MDGDKYRNILYTFLLVFFIAITVMPASISGYRNLVARAQGESFVQCYAGSTPISDVAIDDNQDDQGMEYSNVYAVGRSPADPFTLVVYSLDPDTNSLVSIGEVTESDIIDLDVAIEAEDSTVYIAYRTSSGIKVWKKGVNDPDLVNIITIQDPTYSQYGNIVDIMYVNQLGLLYVVTSYTILRYDGSSLSEVYRTGTNVSIIAADYRNGLLVAALGNSSEQGTGATSYGDYKDLIELVPPGDIIQQYNDVYLRDLVGISLSSDNSIYAVFDVGGYAVAKQPFSDNDYFYASGGTAFFTEDGVVIGMLQDPQTQEYSLTLLYSRGNEVNEVIDVFTNYIVGIGSDIDGSDMVFAIGVSANEGVSEYLIYVSSTAKLSASPLAGSQGASGQPVFSHFEFSKMFSHFDANKWYDPIRVIGPIMLSNNTTVISRYYIVTRVQDYDPNSNTLVGNPGVSIFLISISPTTGTNISRIYISQGVIDPYDAVQYSIGGKENIVIIIAGESTSDNTAMLMYYNITSGVTRHFTFPSYIENPITLLIPLTCSSPAGLEERIYAILNDGTVMRVQIDPNTGDASLVDTGLSIPSYAGGRSKALVAYSTVNSTILAVVLSDQAKTLTLYNLTISASGMEFIDEITYLPKIYDSVHTFIRDSHATEDQQGLLYSITLIGTADGNGTVWYYNKTMNKLTISYTNSEYDLYDIESITVLNTPLIVIVGGKVIQNGVEVIILKEEQNSVTEIGNYTYPGKTYNFGYKVIADPQAPDPIFIVFSHGSPQGVVVLSGAGVASQPLPVPEPPVYITVTTVIALIITVNYLKQKRKH